MIRRSLFYLENLYDGSLPLELPVPVQLAHRLLPPVPDARVDLNRQSSYSVNSQLLSSRVSFSLPSLSHASEAWCQQNRAPSHFLWGAALYSHISPTTSQLP